MFFLNIIKKWDKTNTNIRFPYNNVLLKRMPIAPKPKLTAKEYEEITKIVFEFPYNNVLLKQR